MDLPSSKGRRSFRWSKQARDIVRSELARIHREGGRARLHDLVNALAEESGNPRDACLRFSRQLGVTDRRPYRPWSAKERQELLSMLELQPVRLVALKLKRSTSAVYGMLHRLGTSALIGKDGFTKYLLASLIHARPDTIQKWIDRGLLPARIEGTEQFQRTVIAADDFERFCKTHSAEILKHRIRSDRVEFILHFVFPRSHVDLLPVRSAKKERAAYEAQMSPAPEPDEQEVEVDLESEEQAEPGTAA
jgi:hypothetical protein